MRVVQAVRAQFFGLGTHSRVHVAGERIERFKSVAGVTGQRAECDLHTLSQNVLALSIAAYVHCTERHCGTTATADDAGVIASFVGRCHCSLLRAALLRRRTESLALVRDDSALSFVAASPFVLQCVRVHCFCEVLRGGHVCR